VLRRLRERSGLSQQELAERADLTPHAISALERGTRTRPYPHTVRSLADALELSDPDRAVLISAVPKRRRGGVHPEHRAEPPPNDETVPTRFVVPPTPLHGREQDVAELVRLTSDERLVTLTGPGGVGKTRLAAAVSDAVSGHYPDGVVRISLANLSQAASVMAAVGRALGVAGGDGPETYDAVATHLHPASMLLVLDNFEHLLSAAPEVGRLIAQCPRLTVLTTSRSPLRVRAEREYVVQPLDLPTATTDTVEQLQASPAGALVLDRVRAVSGGDQLSNDDVRALTELCHRLAGLPLALELATAHVRLLGPRALLDRLDHATASSSARDLPPRQRTMRATLDWSLGLLDEDERLLFTLLGVFRGGADLTAIEALPRPAVASSPTGSSTSSSAWSSTPWSSYDLGPTDATGSPCSSRWRSTRAASSSENLPRPRFGHTRSSTDGSPRRRPPATNKSTKSRGSPAPRPTRRTCSSLSSGLSTQGTARPRRGSRGTSGSTGGFAVR
jgi:transcriptional regulator with XRE-family HTH domain